MRQVNELKFKFHSKGYVSVKFHAHDGVVETSTGRKISKEDYTAKNFDKGTKAIMSRLENAVTKFAESKDRGGQKILKADIEEIIAFELDRKVQVKTAGFAEDFETYHQRIKKGDITNKGKVYGNSTLKHLDAISIIVSASPVAKVKTSVFTLEHHQELISYMIGKGLSQNTLSTYNSYILGFFRRTKAAHKNKWYLDEPDINIASESVENDVALSVEELDRLEAISPLSAYERETLDLIIYGCNMGMRHGDLVKRDNDIMKDDTLQKRTQKRNAKVEIPMNKKAREIYEKYGGKLPVRQISTINTSFKRFCKKAKIDEVCIYARTEGGKVVEYIEPKYQLVSSHTMRRTFATNAWLGGVDIYDIKEMLGHKKIETTIGYLKITKEQAMKRLKNHSYFQ